MVEELVVTADMSIPFVRGFIYNSVVGDSGASYYSFNNLKWFESIWSLDKLYKAFNINSPVNYNLEGIVKLVFRIFGGGIVKGIL